MEQNISVLIPVIGWTAIIGVALTFMVMRFKETPYIESRCVVLLATTSSAMLVVLAAAVVHVWLGTAFPALAGSRIFASLGLLIGIAIAVLIVAILAILIIQGMNKAKKAAAKASGNAAKRAAETDPSGTLEEFLKKAKSGNLKEKDIIDLFRKFDPDGKGDPEQLWDWLKGNELSGMTCTLGKLLLPELEKMKKTGQAGGQPLSKDDLAEVQRAIDFIKKHCPEEQPPSSGGDDDH
jgi:large-conductance mechanosensitive channel